MNVQPGACGGERGKEGMEDNRRRKEQNLKLGVVHGHKIVEARALQEKSSYYSTIVSLDFLPLISLNACSYSSPPARLAADEIQTDGNTSALNWILHNIGIV